MFGLFTQDKEIPAIAALLEQALQESNAEIAANDFQAAILAHPAIVSHLRTSCRKTIKDLCAKDGIKNAAQQSDWCDRIEKRFDELLCRAASEYLSEYRAAQKPLPDGIQRGLVIEFASF
ncbi:MAG: hypothetical protein H7Y38_14965 [Armatimonadetes bacterium]|nr:hypothetical protein [Armatimonadota bacterium]